MGDNDQGLTKVKALETSVQPRFSEVSDDVISRAYLGIIQLGQAVDQFPPYGSPAREQALRNLIRTDIEPILTGSIGAMVARFVALGWSIHGGRNKAARARRMLADAEGGDGWSIFVSKLVEDMLVSDRGGFMELGTLGESGPVRDIYNLDAACCGLTGNQAWPVVYTPKVGKKRKQKPLDRDHVVHLPNMPSPDETLFDRGLCLHGDSTVLLADGSYRRISTLVKEKHPGPILTMDDDGQLVSRPIVSWHANPVNGRKFINVRGKEVRHCRGCKERNSWVTEDHPIRTPGGWCEARYLEPGDKIVTKYPFPNQKQKELLIGTLLGDAYAGRPYKNTRLQIAQNSKQKEWLYLKLDALSEFGWLVYKDDTAYRQMNVEGYMLKGRGRFFPSLNIFRERFYPNGKKVIPLDWVKENLSPLMLAAWYLDDGHINHRNPGPKNNNPSAAISSRGFPKENIVEVCQILTDAGYNSHPKKSSRGGYDIYITVEGSRKFFEDIAPYVPESMRYKLPHDSKSFESSLWELGPAERFIDEVIVSRPTDRIRGSKFQTVYDIGVGSTHNFVSAGIIVHNSPVSRALRAAQILRLVNEHDIEQLQNLPPQGLLTVMNITESQWKDALTKYREGRKKAGMDVFPGLLVIAGQSITNPPGVELTPFSTLPLGFNKRETVEIYVKTLALALGIDVAEIWLIPQVGATKAAFTVQHMKARGKGIGYILGAIERAMNFHVMPRGVQFAFDFQDDEQDAAKAEVQGKKILNIKRMFENRKDGEALISREEGRQLLVQEGILSPVFADADEVTLEDMATKTWEDFRMATKSHYLGIAPPVEMPKELVRVDRKGRVVDVVLRPNWVTEQKQASEADEELLEELGEPLGEDEAVEGWEVTETDVRRNRRAWDGLLDRFRRQA